MNPLIQSADNILRNVMPCVLLAVGLQAQAESLKNSNPIVCKSSIVSACIILNQLCETHGIKKHLALFVREAKFWCEAAILAAAENDEINFKHHVKKLITVMENIKGEEITLH